MTTRDAIIAAARARSGRAYRLDPPPDERDGTIDCSLLILEAARDGGAPLPPGVRTAEEIRQAVVPIENDAVLPADLIFFEHTYPAEGEPGPDGRIASHVGFSLGRGTGLMLDAHDERSNGAPDVSVTNIRTDYWTPKILGFGRLPALTGATVDDGNGPMPTDPPRGIDVASHQGAVDWAAVAASGIAFAFTKATGGTEYRNPTFTANWLGMKAAGIKRGAYHFAFETSVTPFPGEGPEAEAETFLAAVLPLGIERGDMLVLDIEDGRGPLGEWALRWCRRVEQRTGIVPLVYSGAWFAAPHGFADAPELARYPLWIAAYQDAMPKPTPPWEAVAFWQFTDRGAVPGVNGAVDMNVFIGPADALALIGKPGAEVIVPAPAVDPDEAPDPRDAQISGLLTAVAHLADVVAAIEDADTRLDQARQIREQFVGPRPAA